MLPSLAPWFSSTASPVPSVAPHWWLAIGKTDTLPGDFIWRDRGIAIAQAPMAFSPNQRFIIIGDAYLVSNKLASPQADALAQIATLWQQRRFDCPRHLSGLFAFAVWDRDTQELWLVRDPIGAYQLYYTTAGATRWIAPRLATLKSFRSNQIDRVALGNYLSCAFVPGRQTLWQDVRKLRPGTCLQLPQETVRSYWSLTESIQAQAQPMAWHSQRLREQLIAVVKAYLPRNEPVGVYLSGGLDSSCITALAAQLHPEPVHTYSIHFGEELPNELAFSSLLADHCGTQHHILEISPQQLWRRLPDAIAQLDEPIGDPLTVPNLIMAEAARSSVGVILNGEGGDPCFGGPKNQPMLLNRLYAEPDLDDSQMQDVLAAYLNSFKKCASDLPNLLQPEVWHAVKHAPSVFLPDLQDNTKTYLNRLMSLNIRFKGADHILTKVNNLTRAANLVGLSPLFDPRIVALSMTVPPTYKLSGAEEKAVLKAAVADLLPEGIIQRPKSGMLVPVQYGFRQVWSRQARGLLLNRRAAIAPYLNQKLIRQWLAYKDDTWGRYGVKLWLLSSLELWLQQNL